MTTTITNPTDLAQQYAQTIDHVAKALECDPQDVKLMATAASCSQKIAIYEFGKLLELSESHCPRCLPGNSQTTGHCDACARRIAKELYRRMHQGPQPNPAETKNACLVARCRLCGQIGAASVIEMGSDTSIDLGQIVQKSLRGFIVRIENGPCAISGCNCQEEARAK